MTTFLLCKERLIANLVDILCIMAGGRRRILRQFTGIPPWRRRTAPTHQANTAVLPASEGTWLMRLQVNVTKKKKKSSGILWCFSISWFYMLVIIFLFSIYSPARLSLIPSVADILTFCNNPECFLKFNVSTLDNRKLFKGLGHHVKI